MLDMTILPTTPEGRCRVLADHATREEARLGWRWLRWVLAVAYCDGQRVFQALDPFNVSLGTAYLRKDGKMPLQVTELLARMNDLITAIGSLDVGPAVVQDDSTLSSIRERTLAQLFEDSLIDKDSLRNIHTQFATILTGLGCCGLMGTALDDPTVGLTGDIEVVHPREIFSFPSIGWDYTKVSGIMRQRVVSLGWLERKLGRPITGVEKAGMDLFYKVIGEAPSEQVSDTTNVISGFVRYQATGMGIGAHVSSLPTSLANQQLVAKIRQLWLYGPRGTCTQYVCTSGKTELINQEFYKSKTIAYVPLHMIRFMENMGFYGAGVFDMVFSMVREFEKLVEQLIQNAKDAAQWPVTILPQGVFAERSAFKNDGFNLRYITAALEPSYTGENALRPTVIDPPTSGEMPGRTAAFVKQMFNDVLPLRDIFREKGRVDSLGGLQYLDEQGNKKISTPMRNTAAGYGGVYRSILSDGTAMMMTSPRAIPVGKLNLDLAGAVIDWDSGSVTFKGGVNPVPDISRLQFTIKDVSPKSKAIRKQEALDIRLKDPQLSSRDGFIRLALDEGLDFAADFGPERAAYEAIVAKILRLYNDGVTPGRIIVTPHTERPDFQLRILEEFMQSRKMEVASVAVINAFIKYRKTLMQYLNVAIPQGVPDPYDGLLAQQAAAAMIQQQGGQQQPPQAALPPMMAGAQ